MSSTPTRLASALPSSPTARAVILAAIVGTVGVMGTAGLAIAQAEPPDASELRAQIEAMKAAAASDDPEAAETDQPDPDAKPTPPPAGEKSKDLSSEESIARFQQLLQRRPFHGPAFNGLVEDYAKRGKLADLITEYTSKVAALPDDVALKVVLARLHLRAGDAAAAGALLGQFERLPMAMSRQNTELLVLKSEVFQRTGDNAGAERMLREAQGLAASVSETLHLGEALADLYLRDGKKDQAIAALEELAAKYPDNYLHQKHIAQALSQRDLHDAALARYGDMLKLVANEVDRKCEVLRELGMAQEKLGKRDEAIASYIEAIGLLSSDHWLQKELHERVVTLYRSANRLQDLADYCAAQIRRAPEQTAMRVLLADVQSAMAQPDLGKQTLADAVELFPKDLALSQKRVEYLERAGDAAGIASEFQRIIGQHPADTELYISYGQFLAANHQVDGARNQWRHVLSTKVDDTTLAIRLGALFEAYELYDDAGEAYERAITVNPKQPDPYIALSRMWLLRADADKAAAALARLGAANPNDGSVQAALAQALRNLGKLEAALEAIGRACEIAPDQVKYHQARAELLVQNGQLEQALAVRRSIIDRVTNAVQQSEAIATLVSMYAAANKLAALADQEKQRLAQKPGDVNALLILARTADAQRDFVEARKAIDQLLEVQPGNATALTLLAKLQDATGDIDAATTTYATLIQLHPARARQFYEAMVDVKLRYSDKAGAVSTLESMAQADPTNVATMSAVAEQLVRMDEADRALPYFERALRAQPDRHESRLEFGKALLQVGRLEDAMEAFKLVAQQRTDTDRAAEALAKLHDVATQLGSLEELMDELHKQVEVDPHNTLVARVLAQLLVQEFEYERAMEVLDTVLRHNPRDVDVAMGRAELLRRLARFDEAVDSYQRVLRLPQIDRDYVLGELGKTNFESGQVDQARRLWRQVQNKMYAGSLLKNNGLLEDAITVLEEGIRLKPDDYALHRNLVATLESAGRTADALAAARRLLDLEPGNVWNIERLAAAHLRAGDRAGASQVASRLFSAGVGEDRTQQAAGQYGSYASAMQLAAYASYSSAYGYGSPGGRTNLERGINFFTQNGLMAELEAALTAQIAAQPDNAVLKKTAADVLSGQLNKPELALSLMRELETGDFPVEHQSWLGKSSQRDHFRVQQYNLIASKPALRDQELARLEAKGTQQLSRDDLLEFAIVRKALGNNDSASELLTRAIEIDSSDTLALGVLTELLVGAEKYQEAEPHARKLIELLGDQRAQMQPGIIERVRREFVRTLPLELQLRVTEDLLADIADKWTMGAGWSWYGTGTDTPGYLAIKLTLATICAETDRMPEARQIWQELAPKRGPDVDRWTMLGDTVQLHDQEDLAFEFYSKGLEAAAQVTGDTLLQQVYTSTTSQRSWYGEDNSVDKAFSSIVGSFEKRGKLVELYDFLRNTNQEGRAKRLAEQYKLGDQLKTLYAQQVEVAAKAFKASSDSPLKSSVPYFAQVCKLAELYDREGNWDEAQKVYERYCADFPNELGLLQTLGEVAQARQKTDEAIRWEKQVLECKSRLATKSREWSQRELAVTPSRPQPLVAGRANQWTWAQRWGGGRYANYYGGGSQNQLERWPSWMRLAQLYLAEGNHLAAGDAMQRGVGEATTQRQAVIQQASALIQQRQLTAKMLPVLRTLAVYAPADERVQLAFADALEASGRKELAAEVCNRLLRRGVTDLGMLTEIRRRLVALNPEQAADDTTIATLEADVAASPDNLKARLRLAKAYYYALRVDEATTMLAALAQEAPHLEGIHEMLVEVYTLRDDSERLVEALKAQIERTTEERQRRQVRWRLVDELLTAGRNDEALATVKELGDPRDPRSYSRIGTLLQYFGRHEEAIECLEKTKASTRRQYYGGDQSDFSIAQAMVIAGNIPGAATKILDAVAEQAKQQIQYGGVYGMHDQVGNPFQRIEHVFVLYPALATEVTRLLDEKLVAAPADPQLTKLAMGLSKSLGRPDKSEAMLEKMIETGASDQALVAQQIDRVLRRKDFATAIAMAEKFIAQQQRFKLAPGVPAQYAGQAALQSPRTFMLCKLGDVYWEMGDKDKAMETYKQIVDPKFDETKLAYATICIVRGRMAEASTLVEEALAAAQVKPPTLLQLRAGIAALEGKAEAAFDAIAEAAKHDGGADNPYSGYQASPVQSLASIAQLCGMTDRFAAFLREKIAKNPLDWESHEALANSYRQAGRPDDAMAVLDDAQKQPALAQQVLTLRLQWVRSSASLDELIELQRKSIELAEKNVGQESDDPYSSYRGRQDPSSFAREELGRLLWEKGDFEGARQAWTERSNAQRSETYVRLGQLYLQQHAYEDAEKAFARAVELDPDNSSVRMSLAEQMYQRGDFVEMLPHMHEVFIQTAGSANTPRQYSYGDDSTENDPEKLNEWAAALSAEPAIATLLASPEAQDRAGDYRVMLTALTGDWPGLEAALAPLIEAGTHDPVAWTLWASVQQRKCDWQSTASALSYLKRSKLTTIAQHRDRLKLVLAGKQFKEAAAGTRQSAPGAGMQPPPPTAGYGGYYQSSYGYSDSSQGADLLPSIYIKLGDSAKAERSYLISGGGDGVESRLPQLASLMWDQDAKDRALELMRLALMSGGNVYGGGARMVPQYAGMLADSGKVSEAIELLIRAYRWDSTGERDNRYGGMYNYGRTNESVDSGMGEAVGSALYELLLRHGQFEATLSSLSQESAQNPEDPRLAQLVISMQKRGGRWADLRESLAGWKAARPNDLPMKLEDFHAACQLQQWEDALKSLAEIRKDSPETPERWTLHEAFVRFAMEDLDGSVALLTPLLSPDVTTDEPVAHQATSLLLCMDRLSPIISTLEERLAANDLDSSRKSLLQRLYVITGERDKAFALAADEFWKSPETLNVASVWYRSLCALAGSGNAPISPSAARPADAALLTLITRGPREGLAAFTQLSKQASPSVEALRGLVLAAELSGNNAVATDANAALLEWLAPRRFALWYTADQPPLQRVAKRAIAQASRWGMNQVAMSGSQSIQLSDAFSQRGDTPATMMYEPLHAAHLQLHTALLARAGKAEELGQALRQQARMISDNQGGDPYGQQQYGAYFSQMRSSAGRSSSYRRPSQFPSSDWQAAVRESLWSAGRADVLAAEYARANTRFGRSEWEIAGASAAAAGNDSDASRWRLRRADAIFASLAASDTPDLGSSTRDPWRWYYGYSSASQESNRIRFALMATLTDAYTSPDHRSLIQGEAEQLWELALLEPTVERRLLAAEKQVGPGWGTTRTFQQLLPYYEAKKNAQKVIDLVESAYEPERITSCPQLNLYVWACYKQKDFPRLERIFAAAQRVGSNMSNDIDIARLMALRSAGRDAQADAIESRLLAASVTETPNRHRGRPGVTAGSLPMGSFDSFSYGMDSFAMQQAMYASFNRRYSNSQASFSPGGNFGSIAAVASSVGVRYDPKVRPEDVTIDAIRSAYQRHGLHAHAARLLDLEIAEQADPRDHTPLLQAKLREQHLAGMSAESAQTAAALEAMISADAKDRPTDAAPLLQLARLYASDAYGADFAKAFASLTAAQNLDPACDPTGSLAVHWLYKLDRHREALDAWRVSQRNDGAGVSMGTYSAPTIFYAAMAANGAGEKQFGQSLARQAIYMYPTHALAAKTQELIK